MGAVVNIQAKKVLVKTKDGHQISNQIQSTEGAGDSAVTSVHQVKEKKSRGGQDYWLCYLLWACGVVIPIGIGHHGHHGSHGGWNAETSSRSGLSAIFRCLFLKQRCV